MVLSTRKNKWFLMLLILAALLIINGCSASRTWVPLVKDNKEDTWDLYNGRIAEYYWKYSSDRHVAISLERAQAYLPYIHQVFSRYNLPPELAYLPILESAFETDAVSRTGAKGLWQFKSGTAKDVGLVINWYQDDRLDWKRATEGAARYLDQLGRRFNYNWELALAAYNGGPNYISKEMKRQRTWNFWNLKLKKQTSQYVPKFLAMLRVAENHYPSLYYRGAPRYWIASR